MKFNVFFLVSLMLFSIISGCAMQETNPEIQQTSKKLYEGKKVLFINSYHAGFQWSDDIETGVNNIINEDTGIELKAVHMDTKNNPSEEFKIEAAKKAKAVIEEFNPNVVIACDDNAYKYLIMEYYRDAELPFTFCGVNWNLDAYEGPYSNTAGMVEVVLVHKAIEEVTQYTEGDKVGFLTYDSLSEYKNEENYKEELGINLVRTAFVKNFDEWKEEFLKLQEEADIVVMGVTEGVKGFTNEKGAEFLLRNTKKPVVSEHAYQVEAGLGLIAFSKLGLEQGEYAATAALRILDGESAESIGVTKNKEGSIALNLKLAQKLGITFSPQILKNTKDVYE